jgi:hypothetical protein
MKDQDRTGAFEENTWDEDESDDNKELRRQSDYSFPISGEESEEDLREALGEEIRVGTDDNDSTDSTFGRGSINSAFPLSGGEEDIDLRTLLGGGEREEDPGYRRPSRVSHPLSDPKKKLPDPEKDDEMTPDDEMDDDVPPRSEWRGF